MTVPDAFEVFAPGRVNLIGEHTDYNDGFVLPLAIEPGITMRVSRRPDRVAIFTSERPGAVAARFDLDRPIESGARDWTAYPAGVIAGCQRLGWIIPGFEAAISTNLPVGGGLSSSAALEVATATMLETLCGVGLELEAKALLCQQAEHEFAGVPCGIMDQFAVTSGRAGHALLLDCRSQVLKHVSLADEVAILVVNSGVKHSLADGEYARRRAECERAATAIGVAALRDASEADLHAKASQLDAVALRRAIHVVSENARVLRFVEAIERHDWPAAGRLMQESHASLRDDYEVSCPELDQLVEIATTVPGVHGCRMTGGGFGGCVVAVVKRSHAVHAMQEIQALYRAATGIDAEAFLTSAAAGAHVRSGGTRR